MYCVQQMNKPIIIIIFINIIIIISQRYKQTIRQTNRHLLLFKTGQIRAGKDRSKLVRAGQERSGKIRTGHDGSGNIRKGQDKQILFELSSLSILF